VKEAFMRMQEEDVAVKPLSNVQQQQQHELANSAEENCL
jgi:hypothetical protein